MARLFLLRSAPVNKWHNPPRGGDNPTNIKTKTEKKKFGEVVGGTAAECTAVCCCCPCAVMNLLVMAVYTVPAGLCKKTWRRRRQKRLCSGVGIILPKPNSSGPPTMPADVGEDCGEDEVVAKDKEKMEMIKEEGDVAGKASPDVNLEKEMWDTFYGAGFWRSSSQRDSTCDESTSRMLDSSHDRDRRER